jgi:hypothetical protein
MPSRECGLGTVSARRLIVFRAKKEAAWMELPRGLKPKHMRPDFYAELAAPI